MSAPKVVVIISHRTQLQVRQVKMTSLVAEL